jgi:hypothetical protein
MNSLIRSLDVIEAEISFYKSQTATGIIEVGKRLIEAKEQIPHGEWGKWLEEKVEFSQVTATRFMRVAEEFGNLSAGTNLSGRKLWLLLDVPAESRQLFIEQPHEVSGRIKTVDEMTTRELQKAIKERKEAEEKAKQLEEENRVLRERPEPEPKTIEVVPKDYQQIKQEKDRLISQNQQLLEQKQQLSRQLQEQQVLETDIISFNEFRQNVGYFLEKMSKYTFYSEVFSTIGKQQQGEFLKQVEKIDIWVTEVKQSIKGQKSEKTIIFEGGFISERIDDVEK